VLLELQRHFRDIVEEIEVHRFERVGSAFELNALLRIKDGSAVAVKDYVFRDGTRKYAYQWRRAGKGPSSSDRRRWCPPGKPGSGGMTRPSAPWPKESVTHARVD
jgi:hypothetical protein